VSDPLRAILHLDLDAFFAAVEMLENPRLAGKPVLVGGRERGVVAAASYEARTFGARSAMPMTRALQLCPEAIVVPPRHRLYRHYSRRVMSILRQTSDLMEQMSIDEAYLDVTSLVSEWQGTVAIARQLQRRVKDEIGLSASLGVATNKLLAKIASDRDKPGGLTVVRPGEETAFLAPLPVRVLWGVGPVTARKLFEMGVTTIGQLAQVPGDVLEAHFGRPGLEMAQRARGIDHRPVVTEHEPKSVSQEETFIHDLTDWPALRQELWSLSQGVARRLKDVERSAGTVAIKVRYSDFATLTRQMSLAVPTDDEKLIYDAALVLLERSWRAGRPVRLLGVGGYNLSPPSGQLRLL